MRASHTKFRVPVGLAHAAGAASAEIRMATQQRINAKRIGGSAVMTLLRKNALWLVMAIIAGAAGAWLFYASQPHLYRSTAQVDVETNPIVVGTPTPPNMVTEQQVATSGVIVGRTAKALGLPLSTVQGHVSANVASTANVLSINCTMPTPIQARDCAQAAAAAYRGFRNIPAGTREMLTHDPLHVTMLTYASLPTAPAGTGKGILLPIGAILGLALGLGAVVIRDHFDDRVRDRADLERCLEAPVLAGVPRVRRRGANAASIFSSAPSSTAAEAYRYLRSRLRPYLFSGPAGGKVLLVAGPQGLEGRTCVSANLGRALAQAGVSVLLVDADLRHRPRGEVLHTHPSLSEVFRAGTRPGLTELLAGTASLDEVAGPAGMPGLRLVGAGSPTAQAADLFEVANLIALFADMKAVTDVVVVDSAPVLAVSDAVSLARASDLVVMVADVRRTGRGAVSAAAQEIRATGPRGIIGVLNREPLFANRRAPSISGREREWLAAAGSGAVMPPGIMAAGRQNGQRPVQVAVTPTWPHEPPGTGTDDQPETGPASR